MDKATLIGVLAANGAMLYGIIVAGASLKAFWDTPSVIMVFGGAIAVLLIAFPFASVMKFFAISKKVFFPKVQPVTPVITQLVEFAEIARRDGILALENKTASIQDPFVLMGLQMAIDGTEAEVMEAIMRSEVESMATRHKFGKTLMETTARYAPAFGMIGTLIGLIIMLGNMSNPDAIGPGMAVALLTTLYGAYIANAFCLPVADKLAFYSRKEIEIREIAIRGLLSIQNGDNPRVIEQKLLTFLPAKERAAFARNKAAA
ncbi:motility protein A [Planctellipticum variicoloris]|uniref:motility protein A n=1 Tax=Planctellipticum variicoloris TaxID=3064265 RepID=UPI003013BF91|nr:motility protein A [Planctomycetaceae bacterium SH412]